MSRGPGIWQRKILDALASQESVGLWDIRPPDCGRSQRFACRRAAQRLADRGLVSLELVGHDVCVIRLHQSSEVSHIGTVG
jgi:hypothetical protein